MTSTVKTTTIGIRTIAGTDFPIDLMITRFERVDQHPLWYVAVVCNRIGEHSWECHSLPEAEKKFSFLLADYARAKILEDLAPARPVCHHCGC